MYETTLYVESPRLNPAPNVTEKTYYNYTVTLNAGDTYKIDYRMDDNYGVYQPLQYKSNKATVAYVNEDGVICTGEKGKAKITTKINGKTFTINVVVK